MNLLVIFALSAASRSYVCAGYSQQRRVVMAAAHEQTAAPEFVTFPLKTVGNFKGVPNVFTVDVVVSGDITPTQALVDTGSSAVVVLPGAGLDMHGDPASSRSHGSFLQQSAKEAKHWTIKYSGASLDGDTENGQVCLGDAHTCTEKVFTYFQADKATTMFQSLLGPEVQGILGLAPRPSGVSAQHFLDIATLDSFKASGAIKQRTFGLFFARDGSQSELHLGGWDESKVHAGSADSKLSFFSLAQPSRGKWEIPILDVSISDPEKSMNRSVSGCPEGECRVLLDSGTALLEAAPSLMDALMKAYPVEPDCSNRHSLPDLHFALPGASFTLGPEDFVIKLANGRCTLGAQEVNEAHWMNDDSQSMEPPLLILGQVFLQKHYTVYDVENGRVGVGSSSEKHGLTDHEANAKDYGTDNSVKRTQEAMSDWTGTEALEKW